MTNEPLVNTNHISQITTPQTTSMDFMMLAIGLGSATFFLIIVIVIIIIKCRRENEVIDEMQFCLWVYNLLFPVCRKCEHTDVGTPKQKLRLVFLVIVTNQVKMFAVRPTLFHHQIQTQTRRWFMRAIKTGMLLIIGKLMLNW